jgi:hypothetical protein
VSKTIPFFERMAQLLNFPVFGNLKQAKGEETLKIDGVV